jgi:hypothetical protein
MGTRLASRRRTQSRNRHALRSSVEFLEPRTLLTGPTITAIAPTTVINGTYDHVDVTFDTAIDPTTFTVVDASLTGPPGVGSIPINSVVEQDSTHFELQFTPLTTRGAYQVAIGPNIADTQGNLMDQNQNGVGGEPGDLFQASLTYVVADTIFTAGTTITEANTAFDGQDIAIVGATVAIDGPHNFRSVHLVGGAVLTHSANTSTQTHKLDLNVTGQVIVDATSRIDVSGKGYLSGRTSGNTTVGGATNEGGGSHGGRGWTPYSYSTTNAAYGDYADPDDWGAGGSSSSGGGLVRVMAGALALDGWIAADGASRGDGAGGSVYVAVATLSGGGGIRADGGHDTNGYGGGGGGRVAVYAADLSGFATAQVTARGGLGYSGTGGAGTVYLRDTDEAAGTLVVDNGSGSGGRTVTWLGLPGPSAVSIPDRVLVQGSRTLVLPVQAGVTITFQQDVTVTGAGQLGQLTSLVAFVSQGGLTVSGGGLVQTQQTVALEGVLTLTAGSELGAAGTITSLLDQTVNGGVLRGGRIVAPNLTIKSNGLVG